ncbi:MAG: outer membrane protein assembly factor BamD [Deltaproteobacteria bacterium]|nr:MAG: outer membrane protein assembly factor BamD [Deltaproteobacteria bacterium]
MRLTGRLALFALAPLLAVGAVLTPVGEHTADAATAPSEPEGDGRVAIGPELREPALDLPDAVREDLAGRQWDAAATGLLKLGEERLAHGDTAFVAAWALVHADRADEAAPLLDALDKASLAPDAYVQAIRGEILREEERNVDALAALEAVPADVAVAPRAEVLRAEVLKELSRTKEAYAVYESMIARPDPSPGNPEALIALARRAGAGSEEAYPLYRRIWVEYPKSEHSQATWDELKSYGKSPTWQEVGRRAEVLMGDGEYDAALAETEPVLGQMEKGSLDACRIVFVRGRSNYKRNRLSASVAAFGDVVSQCAEVEEDYGAKALYIKGLAQFRRSNFTESAREMAAIPEHFPKSSYADDGYTHAGIALWEAEDKDGARAMWAKNLEAFPEGDTVPESTFRLAWSYYEDGDAEKARAIAQKLSKLPLGSDERHVTAGRYWAARWLAYPNVEAPTELNEDAAAVGMAVAEWKAFIEELPTGYYALLAQQRLRELAPEVAKALDERTQRRADLSTPWRLEAELVEDPAFVRGVALARLGLIQEARAEWDRAEVAVDGDAMAWMTELRVGAGDWLLAHDGMRRWLAHHPPGTLGEREPEILRVAYPDRYWEEVRTAADGDRYDPRLFHALVREESNFNRRIVSFAGAKGLSQLMPPTAKQVAGWLGRPVGDLYDPVNNTQIGARYLDALHKQFGSPFLSLAAYNAGGGRVNQWLERHGNVPTDEYVERIPYRETRGYVKRVSGTWTLLRYQFDEGPAFADLSALNHVARPTE